MTISNKEKVRQTQGRLKPPSKRSESAVDVTYHEICKTAKNREWMRPKLVKYALEHGIRPAAREFGCATNTVMLWVSRKDEPATTRNQDRSKAPKTVKNRTSGGDLKIVSGTC